MFRKKNDSTLQSIAGSMVAALTAGFVAALILGVKVDFVSLDSSRLPAQTISSEADTLLRSDDDKESTAKEDSDSNLKKDSPTGSINNETLLQEDSSSTNLTEKQKKENDDTASGQILDKDNKDENNILEKENSVTRTQRGDDVNESKNSTTGKRVDLKIEEPNGSVEVLITDPDTRKKTQANRLNPKFVNTPSRNVDQEVREKVGSILGENKVDLVFQDSDSDGIFDYDEEYVFGTDPNNARTAGSDLTDKELIEKGRDPRTAEVSIIEYDDPRQVKQRNIEEALSVSDIKISISSGEENEEQESVGTSTPRETLVLSGTAFPNSIVTVFIYSTPIIVTIQADSQGRWTYELEQELPDGEHEVYVATVDGSGKILNQSEPVTFAKTAQAVSFQSLENRVDQAKGSLEDGVNQAFSIWQFIKDNLIWSGILVVVLIALIWTILLGVLKFATLNK